MILPFMLSDGELAMSELGDLEDLALLLFGMMCLMCVLLLLLLAVFWFVVVRGRAVLVRRAHIHNPAVFTGAASICGHTTSPALAITGG